MIDTHSKARAQRKAIRDEAYRRAASWLGLQPRAWRSLDCLIRQIAPSMGRDYTRLARGTATDSDPSGEAGRKALARAVLKKLVDECGYETHTDRDGRQTFSRIWSGPGARGLLVNPDDLRLPDVSGVVLRDLTHKDRRRVTAVDDTGNPWNLPDPIEVVTSPGGRGVAAVVGSRVVGYAVYSCGNSEATGLFAHVARLAVAPKWRRRGIGTLLLRSVEARAICECAIKSPRGLLALITLAPEPCLPVQIMLRGLGYAIFGPEAVLPREYGDADGYGFCHRVVWSRPEQPMPTA